MDTMFPRDSFSDQHSIDTPEQMQLQLTVAGIGSRFLALALDTLVQLGFALLLLLVIFFLGISLPRGDWGPWIAGVLVVGAFLIYFGYFAIFEIMWNGQTPGKHAVGIRVIKDTGRPLTAGEHIGRNLMRLIDQLPSFYAVGIICALFNSQNKRLGDLLVGAILVREMELKDAKPVWHSAGQSVPSADVSGVKITVDQLRLIDTFLTRRHMLNVQVRQRTAVQILTRLNIEVPADKSLTGPVETILEALAYQKRSTGHMRD
jgi:uncharacterized RDD family membrane protein YckC